MSCRYAQVERTQIPVLGGAIEQTEVHCALKRQSQQAMLQVYGKLFDLGLEGSIVRSTCPVARNGRWAQCPFRQP